MQLSYRGLYYEIEPSMNVEVPGTAAVGQYRGGALRIEPPILRSSSMTAIVLRYRGSYYVQ
jgi:Domain of unknown function (DUF4278)